MDQIDAVLSSTPEQYLEKIFQIPFTLPTMTDAGYGNLIRSLAPELADAGESATQEFVPDPSPSPSTEPPTPRVPMLTDTTRLDRGSIPVERGSVASAEGTDPSTGIDLTSAEVAFAARLGPLVDSPRLAKRMMNCYRMLRSTRYTGTTSSFLGESGAGDSQALLQLLAIMTGYPDQFDDIALALAQSAEDASWSDFVGLVEPTLFDPDDGGPEVYGNKIVGATGSATATWQALHSSLRRVLAASPVPQEIGAYRTWAPIVARFSFSL